MHAPAEKDRSGVLRVVELGEINLVQRIGCPVVKLLAAVRLVNILPFGRGEADHSLLSAFVKDGNQLRNGEVVKRLRREFGIPESRQAVPSETRLTAPGQVEHGGEKVASADQMTDSHIFGNSGPGDYERHVYCLAIKVVTVAVKALLTEFFAVVGSDDEDGVAALGCLVEKIEQAADLRVEKGQAVVIGRDQRGLLVLCDSAGRVGALQGVEQRVDQLVWNLAEAMVKRRARQVGHMDVKIVDKKEIGTRGRAPKPAESLLVGFTRVLALEIVKAEESLVGRLDERRSQQCAGQIALQ